MTEHHPHATDDRIRLTKGTGDCHALTFGAITLVFSYQTCVAFAVSGWGWARCENIWGASTAKHLNALVPAGVPTFHLYVFRGLLDQLLDHACGATDWPYTLDKWLAENHPNHQMGV